MNPNQIADEVVRQSYGKLIAVLSARTGDVAAAEDALSEAFVSALADWPRNGVPANPEGWLLTVARRRLIDADRRRIRGEEIMREIVQLSESAAVPNHEIPDERLALMFACAHPAIEAGVRAPLMLQTVLGLDAKRIASAFLTSPAAMSKRLGRAKERIRQAAIPFEVPEAAELPARLESVLDAIYAAFAEGWSDPGGTDVARRELGEEARYLARLVTELLPQEPEALGLLALMLHAEARRPARRGPDGEYIPLADQNPSLWNLGMIEEAESLLRRAVPAMRFGRYQLEGALQSAHVYRIVTGRNNWPETLRLYDALSQLADSPVVEINRALAVAESQGPEAGLAAMPELAADARLADYQPYWAARAELLVRLGDLAAARHAYEVAIGLERDESVRRFLLRRLADL